MKKLLAMILCVAMVLSIAPAAFAASISGDVVPSGSGWAAKRDSIDAIKELKKDIKGLYYTMAADQAVFGVAKAYHDLADGIAKNMFADIDSVTIGDTKIYHDDLVDNVRAYIKGVIGAEIMDELDQNKNGWYNPEKNTINPEKYMKAFCDAATKAVSSEKAQKGLEALVMGLVALKAQFDANDFGEDLYYAIDEWGMDKFDEYGWENFLTGAPTNLTSDSELWVEYPMDSTLDRSIVETDAVDALAAMGFLGDSGNS